MPQMKSKVKSKYGNTKVTMFGITFDSKKEMQFYLHLLSVYKKEDIKLQPEFVLQDSFKQDGKAIRKMSYVGDFQIGNNVYDVKGFKTEVFKIKEKLFRAKYPELNLIIIDSKNITKHIDTVKL